MLLTKKQESLIKSLYTRHGRKKNNLCICEGKRSVADLLMSKPELVKFTVIAESNQNSSPDNVINPFIVSDRKFSELSATVASQGILAVVERPELLSADIKPVDPFILVLDRLADPGNFGSILRTARAIGLTEVWYTAGSVDPFNDKVIRAAMASQFVVGMRCFANLKELSCELKRFGYDKIFRTDPHQGESCFASEELFSHSAIIIGNEADGVASLDDSVDVTIPMPGSAESLNAAQAATVILFEYIRRHLPGL
jgi:RNA methyltransferase, TrmH family